MVDESTIDKLVEEMNNEMRQARRELNKEDHPVDLDTVVEHAHRAEQLYARLDQNVPPRTKDQIRELVTDANGEPELGALDRQHEQMKENIRIMHPNPTEEELEDMRRALDERLDR